MAPNEQEIFLTRRFSNSPEFRVLPQCHYLFENLTDQTCTWAAFIKKNFEIIAELDLEFGFLFFLL